MMVSLQFRQCAKIQLINYFFSQLYQISNTRNGVEKKIEYRIQEMI